MLSRRALAPTLLAGIAAALSAANAPAGTWYEEQTLWHDGVQRYFRYYVPDTRPPEGYPVLFVLHGGGGDMRSVTNNGAHAEWPEIADEEGILLIVPNGINGETGDPSTNDQNWNDCRADAVLAETGADDVGYVSALIDWAEGEFVVDTSRIHSTGASNGGMMSYRLAFELGDRIAAIAAFIANLPAVSECRVPAHPVAVFICNGDAEDDYMPWDGGCIKQKTSCQRGTVASAEATREFWIRHNHTSPESVEFIPYEDLDPTDGSTAESDRYDRGFEGAEVAFYRIRGGGHTTPSIEHQRPDWFLQLMGLGHQNHDIEGAREAWAFLSRHTLFGAGEAGPPGLSGLLRVAKAPDSRLRLSWAGDCGGGSAYGLYRGDLTLGYGSLAPVPGQCGIPETEVEIDTGPLRAAFFLVVPNDGSSEGAYGSTSSGADRPTATSVCFPQEALAACTAF